MAACCKSDAKLKLHYFNARGRAELIRYILHFAGHPFEDVRYTKEEWPTQKTKFPTGQVPALEIEKDGKTHFVCQSLTIARSLARKHKLTGADEIEGARCDEVVDCLNELTNLALLAFFEQDNDRKDKIKTRLRTEEYPRLLGYLEKKLKENGGKHIVGKEWTWADFAVSLFMHGLLNNVEDSGHITEKLAGLVALCKSVDEIPAIAEWRKKRPETPF